MEKRDSVRFVVENENSVKILPEKSNLFILGKIVNISVSGILIECNSSYINKHIFDNFRLMFKKNKYQYEETPKYKGQVVRVEKKENMLNSFLALQFEKRIHITKLHELNNGPYELASLKN